MPAPTRPRPALARALVAAAWTATAAIAGSALARLSVDGLDAAFRADLAALRASAVDAAVQEGLDAALLVLDAPRTSPSLGGDAKVVARVAAVLDRRVGAAAAWESPLDDGLIAPLTLLINDRAVEARVAAADEVAAGSRVAAAALKQLSKDLHKTTKPDVLEPVTKRILDRRRYLARYRTAANRADVVVRKFGRT